MQKINKNVVARLTASTKAAEASRDFLRDAFLAMRQEMPADEPGRYLFDQCASDEGRCCFLPVVRAMELSAKHGATLDELCYFAHALEVYAELLVAEHAPEGMPRPMSHFLVEEARADAAADIAQTDFLTEPSSPARLHEIIETGERHKSVLDRMIAAARRALLHHHITAA